MGDRRGGLGGLDVAERVVAARRAGRVGMGLLDRVSEVRKGEENT
jgi:hypothetical protein